MVYLVSFLWIILKVISKNITVGDFVHIYDPSVGESEKWYINDHCFINDGQNWNLFGITHQEPAKPLDEKNFAHATARTLLQIPFKKQEYILSAVYPETLLWAPHVIQENDQYYMFYCGGGDLHEEYQINLAISTNMYNWTRYENNPLFKDGFDARDPMVLKVNDQYVMYYCCTSTQTGGNHVVAYRTSKDLYTWSEKKIAFIDTSIGTFGGPTESPFVVNYKNHYYLFICCRDDYEGTEVFKSDDPFHWDYSQKVGHIKSHASEIVLDENQFYLSKCGWGKGGVFIAPLYWDV